MWVEIAATAIRVVSSVAVLLRARMPGASVPTLTLLGVHSQERNKNTENVYCQSLVSGYDRRMSVTNSKMNTREREIGLRLRAFREGIKYSQASFAEIIGLTRDQLASVEYGRTPLKYSVAWKLRFAFGLSLDWLQGGGLSPDDLAEDGHLPHPDSERAGRNVLLTDIFRTFEPASGEAPRVALRRKVRVAAAEVTHRWLMVLALRNQLDQWIASVPDGYTQDFADKLGTCGREYLKSLPADPPALIQARLDGLLWERMRGDIARKASGRPALPK